MVDVAFSPDASLEGDVEIDLRRGISWCALLKIQALSSASRSSIVTFIGADGTTLVEFFLDRDGALVLKGASAKARIEPEHAPVNQPMFPHLFARIMDGRLALELALDGRLKKASEKHTGASVIASMALGDPGGGRGADFKVSDIVAVKGRMKKKDLSKLMDYLQSKAT